MNTTTNPAPHYSVPTAAQSKFNDMVRWLSDHGIGVVGARTLTVVGRTSGLPKSVPVNPTTIDGRVFVISPRGNTQWSRNLRVAGSCEISRGRKVSTYSSVELADTDKVDVLRPYLKRWGWEVGSYLPASTSGKVTHKSTDEELLSVAASVPIFELRPVA